mmetsp:Transcript_3005/g.3564  ORF Transcript_3005/g.3564 Transcript_3005/m.3564 type:complete len:149 (-) Transcript_3005:29-475(-)|eukprot:CAMPEP_0205821212 /NCGR_PEP_ID=MMETSP0206-20130828/6004_1 /ASSEMBLY_ACC=CAM_ASM_000279 /TAXON_ID=36767 /ORGANISM="Euplotes focardii, Strain TN1" /LENGTH=148 /DNA_ID=CAMNT_0053116501 /DNA_START=23 /DNA_END=469 /DNA_ORIENTATION=+
MKRTKERVDFTHPPNREGISGLTYFDGEDNAKSKRVRQQTEENKFWVNRQNEEKKNKDDLDKLEEKLYGKQDIHNNILLGGTQDKLSQNRRMMAKSCYDANQELNKEKKCRETNEKNSEAKKDRDDLNNFTLSKEIKWSEPEFGRTIQ